MEMEFKVSRQKHAVTVKLTGRMDAGSAQRLEEACVRHIYDGMRDFIFDLSVLEYISSAGLRVLLTIGQRLGKLGGRIMLGNVGGQAKEVFDLSGLNSWILQDGAWQMGDAGK